MRSHHNLDAWQKSVDFVLEVYRLTDAFPKGERSCLISQIRRASVSISANIAKGTGRKPDEDFFHFLSNAQGSAEVETELIIAFRLGYLSVTDQRKLIADLDDIGRMITGFSNYLKRKPI